jgi:hypothetical protein
MSMMGSQHNKATATLALEPARREQSEDAVSNLTDTLPNRSLVDKANAYRDVTQTQHTPGPKIVMIVHKNASACMRQRRP